MLQRTGDSGATSYHLAAGSEPGSGRNVEPTRFVVGFGARFGGWADGRRRVTAAAATPIGPTAPAAPQAWTGARLRCRASRAAAQPCVLRRSGWSDLAPGSISARSALPAAQSLTLAPPRSLKLAGASDLSAHPLPDLLGQNIAH